MWDLEKAVLRRGRLVLQGHSVRDSCSAPLSQSLQHNVPCVEFDPSGHLIASISIDRTVRVWDLQRAEMVAQRRIDIHWGWAVRCVRAATVSRRSLMARGRWVREWDVRCTRPTALPPATQLPVVTVAGDAEAADEDEEQEEDDESNSDQERMPLLIQDHAKRQKQPTKGAPQLEDEESEDPDERAAAERARRFAHTFVLCADRDYVYLFDTLLNALARCRFLPDGASVHCIAAATSHRRCRRQTCTSAARTAWH